MRPYWLGKKRPIDDPMEHITPEMVRQYYGQLGDRGLGRDRRRWSERHPVMAGLGYALVGAAVIMLGAIIVSLYLVMG